MKTANVGLLLLSCLVAHAWQAAAQGTAAGAEPSIHGRTQPPPDAGKPPAQPSRRASAGDCAAAAQDAAALRAYEGAKLAWNLRRISNVGESYGLASCKDAQAGVDKASACRAAFDALYDAECGTAQDDAACAAAKNEKSEAALLDSQNARLSDDLRTRAKERAALAACSQGAAAGAQGGGESGALLSGGASSGGSGSGARSAGSAAQVAPMAAAAPALPGPSNPPPSPAPAPQFPSLGDIWNSVTKTASDTWNGVTDTAGKVVGTVTGAVVSGGKAVVGAVTSTVSTIAKLPFNVGGAIANFGKSLSNNAGGGVLGFLKGAAGTILNATGQILQAPWRISKYIFPSFNSNHPDFTNVDCELLYVFNCNGPKAKYARVKGELFVPGNYSVAATTDDIRQTDIGDCYFMSSMAAIAETHPDWLVNHIRDNGNQTYTVTFFNGSSPRTVTVDNEFPVSNPKDANPNPVFAYFGRHDAGTNQNVIWPMVMEKAYAEKSFNGSYNWIGNGGWPDQALDTLTGKKTVLYSPGSVTFDQLAKWLGGGNAVVIASTSGGSDGEWYDDGKIAHSHAYFLKSLDLKNRTITMGNPWGQQDAEGLTEKEFQQNVSGVYVNPVE